MSQQTPPGWYPDPSQPGMQRWWDGSAWGEQMQPDPAASMPPAYAYPGQAGGYQASAGYPQGMGAANIDPWFWQSIVATVLCCLPVGIYAIVKSTAAKSALERGDVQAAMREAGVAKKATLWAVGAGVVMQILSFVFLLGSAALMAS